MNTKIRLKSDLLALESLPTDQPLLIGRRNGCDLNIHDRSISRLHAELIFRKGDGWYLRDLGSKYGTTVNSVPVLQSVRLNEGDHVTIGKLRFTVGLAPEDDTGFESKAVPASTAAMPPPLPAYAPPPPPAYAPPSQAMPGYAQPPAMPSYAPPYQAMPGYAPPPQAMMQYPPPYPGMPAYAPQPQPPMPAYAPPPPAAPPPAPSEAPQPARTRLGRKRIIRIPAASGAERNMMALAIVGFAAVFLVVVIMLVMSQKNANRTVTPVTQGVVERDKTLKTPVSPPVPPPLSAGPAVPPSVPQPEPAPAPPPEPAPPASPAGQRPVTFVVPTTPDGDQKPERAAGGSPEFPEMPKAGGSKSPPARQDDAVPVDRPARSSVPLLKNYLTQQLHSGATLYMDVEQGNNSKRWTVQSASVEGIHLQGKERPLSWEQLGTAGFFDLLQPLIPNAPPAVLAAYLKLGVTIGRAEDPVFRRFLAALKEKDLSAARDVEESMKGTPPRGEATPGPTPSPMAPKDGVQATVGSAAAAPAGSAGPGPSLRPALLMVARVGGPGDQWLRSVAVKEGVVIASGENDFKVTVTVGADGIVRAQTEGKLAARHEPVQGWPPVSRNSIVSGIEYGGKQVHPVLQQPYLTGPGWKLWDWTYDQARTSRAPYAPFMADSGIRYGTKMPNGNLLVVGSSAGASTSLRANPRDIHQPLDFPIATGGGAGESSFLFEITAAGELVRQMVVRGQANAACWDASGRIVVVGHGILRGAPNQFEYPDGAGILFADAAWRNILFGAFIGAEGGGEVSLWGVAVDPASGLAAACGYVDGEIKQVNAFQNAPGGGKDGLLVIFRLWGGGAGRPPDAPARPPRNNPVESSL